jgi:uncharacterized protein (DUF433 family)
MRNKKLIESNPKILSGKPVIKGTRISVAYVLQCMASGMTVDDILRGHPHLTREGVMAALDYAAREMQGEEIHALEITS